MQTVTRPGISLGKQRDLPVISRAECNNDGVLPRANGYGHPGDGRSFMPDEKKDVKRRRPLLRSLSWIFLVAAAAVIGYYAVQGSHGTAAAAVCEAKFLTQPEETSPGSSDWAAYGVTQLNVMPGRSFSIEPAPDLYTDEWFGAALSSPGTCDYRVDFDAEVTGPLHPDAAAMLGYGYSVG